MSGARPVIYLPQAERSWVPDDQLWRCVRFEGVESVDFTHEREWRMLGDYDDADGYYVMVATSAEADPIRSMDMPGKGRMLNVLAMNELVQII